jgi:hypothetical protein
MKTFLLGSAAALGVSGVAQAADLAAVTYAEPVDYVRVCDAFGAGFYYIPGTDTCLRIGGYVRFQVEFGEDIYSHNSYQENDPPDDDDDTNDTDDGASDTSDWRYKARASLDITASSQTDWGPLIGYMELEANFGAGSEETSWVEPQNAFVSLGPFTAGIYQSNFDTGGSYTSAYQLDDGFGVGFTDEKVLQMQLSWAFNGFGIILSAEDPNARTSDAFNSDGDGEWEDDSSQGDIPDLVAALTGEWGNLAAKIAFLYRDTDPSSTWGIQGNVEFSDLFGGLDLLVAGYWIDKGSLPCGGVGVNSSGQALPGGCSFSGYGSGDSWGAQASLKYDWSSMFNTSFTAQYNDYSAVGGVEGWAFAFNTDYKPVDEFMIRGAVRYYDYSDTWNALVEFRRSFGG